MAFEVVKIQRGLKPVKPVLDLLEGKDAHICGGYARYMASPNKGRRLRKSGDVDIYCADEAVFEVLKTEFMKYLEIRFENEMAITFLKVKRKAANKSNPFYGCPVVQLIKPVEEGAIVAKGSLEHILENFDFTVTRAAVFLDNDGKYKVMVDENFMKDEEARFLRILNIHCPISSLIRFMKYARKGYYTRPSQVMKLFVDWDNRPLEYRQRLMVLFDAGAEAGELTPEEIDELEKLLRID